MKIIPVVLAVASLASSSICKGESLVLAGTNAMLPLTFQSGPHIQVTGAIHRAHPFKISTPGTFRIDELHIAAQRFLGSGGAQFFIHDDDSGKPGSMLMYFSFPFLPTDAAQVVTATPGDHVAIPIDQKTLQADVNYWLVGLTSNGQVNWNLALGTPPQIGVNGPNAYRLRGQDWVVNESGSLAAYAILGTPVPEPGSLMLVLATAAAWIGRRH